MAKDLKGIFNAIYEKKAWAGGGSETHSGGGSVKKVTEEFKCWLECFLKVYAIKSMLDAPCGEWGYMQYVNKGDCKYIGIDIVEKAIQTNRERFPDFQFLIGDLTSASMPQVDFILCKDCFQHLSNDKILSIINRFKQTTKYLLTSSDYFPWPQSNDTRPKQSGKSRVENLQSDPFFLTGWIANIQLDRKVYTLWRLDQEPDEKDLYLFGRTLQACAYPHAYDLFSPTSELFSMLKNIKITPNFLRYSTDNSREVIVLPKRNAYFQLKNPLGLSLPAVRLLEEINSDATLEEIIPLAKDKTGIDGVHYILAFIWAAAGLGLISLSSPLAFNIWERRRLATAILISDWDDPLSVKYMCHLLLCPPDWLQKSNLFNQPEEIIFHLQSSSVSRQIQLDSKIKRKNVKLILKFPRSWLRKFQRIVP